MGTFVVTWFTASTSSEVTEVKVSNSVIISSLHVDGESGEVLLSTKHFWTALQDSAKQMKYLETCFVN